MGGLLKPLSLHCSAAHPLLCPAPALLLPRTVLLLGIPDVLSEESMRDALEIHFQKASRGGGEVDALAYVPEGRTGVAVFVEDRG